MSLNFNQWFLVFLTFPLGELEATMLSSFLKAARLKQWLARPDCPDFIKECKVVFDQAFGISTETDHEISITAFGPVPKALRLIVSDRQVALRAHHKFDNVNFSRRSTHVGNSLILFYPGGNRALAPIPGSIEYIIGRQKAPVIYAVYRQLPASVNTADPFRHYLHFNARIFSPALSDNLEVVHPEWVMSHYGRWKLDAERAVILTLSRVSHLLNLLNIGLCYCLGLTAIVIWLPCISAEETL